MIYASKDSDIQTLKTSHGSSVTQVSCLFSLLQGFLYLLYFCYSLRYSDHPFLAQSLRLDKAVVQLELASQWKLYLPGLI